MRTFVNFGAHDQAEALALGIDGIRLDVPTDGGLLEFVSQFVGPDTVQPDFLLHDPDRIYDLLDAIRIAELASSRTMIEVFNENREVETEDQYIDGVCLVYEACRAAAYGGLVIAGAGPNLSQEQMRWYRNTVPALPLDITVAFHDYPYGLQVTDLPWPPSRSHLEAITRLRAITGDRPLACTEVGRHMAHEITGHPPVEIRLTEDWIYRWLIDRLRFYDEQGIVLTAVYQWADDPARPDTSEGLYGIHAVDGARKQQAFALADWRRGRPQEAA